MNTYLIETIIENQNKIYEKFWREILEPNQTEINNITDFKERQTLQATQNKIINYINEQSDTIEYLLKKLAKSPTQNELDYYKKYCKQARFYITNLGGNPSNLSYIKDSDLLC